MKAKSMVIGYDSYLSCNKCSGVNEIRIKDSEENIICECETTCKSCGFTDYWSYGFFESRKDGYNMSKKY